MKTLISISVILLLSSCRINNKGNNLSEKTLKDTLTNFADTDSNAVDSQDVLYVKPNSLVFFSLSEKEFKQFLHRSGTYSEWDFETIYKQFKKTAKNTKSALKNVNVNYVYAINPTIAFITKSGDTLLFNRKEKDLFIGQIFFNGEDTLYMEEGLLKRDSLENKITHYFNLKEDINIKRPVIYVDNQAVIKKDTIKKIPVDTLINP
ncbi:MAG: hypothetical protein GXO80_01370 [Chlorobi bacterium]|nr:hypothetical protein [Chlorobiota bacterium]